MNCQEFERRAGSNARGALADARMLAEAAAHEETCAACAARLADERALSTGLRALASGMKGAEAPARVEVALVAALRARAASESKEDSGRAGHSNVVPLTAGAQVRRWSWVKTAAAASMAAAASLALFVLVRPGAGVDAPRGGGEVNQRVMIEPPPDAPGAGPGSEVAWGATAGVEENSPLKVEEGSPAEVDEGAAHATGVLKDRTPRATFTPRARAVNASYGGGARGAHARPTADARAQEVATEFIPLMQGVPYPPAEEAHLVRVELPRSALASFGLPVGADSAGGRVKADVLLGEDGIARAIRFVR
ncbi:MAG: hypothetical protein LC795_11275 [Acidobacteria bacterium]|nr:hypothetical protein [Acidobacteriota bacterium]MCA1619872.1 hypothetical protein [Acidobacteriota bacterium]